MSLLTTLTEAKKTQTLLLTQNVIIMKVLKIETILIENIKLENLVLSHQWKFQLSEVPVQWQ